MNVNDSPNKCLNQSIQNYPTYIRFISVKCAWDCVLVLDVNNMYFQLNDYSEYHIDCPFNVQMEMGQEPKQ